VVVLDSREVEPHEGLLAVGFAVDHQESNIGEPEGVLYHSGLIGGDGDMEHCTVFRYLGLRTIQIAPDELPPHGQAVEALRHGHQVVREWISRDKALEPRMRVIAGMEQEVQVLQTVPVRPFRLGPPRNIDIGSKRLRDLPARLCAQLVRNPDADLLQLDSPRTSRR